MSIGTWNIQGLRTKREEVVTEINKMNIDIIILTETKKKATGEEDIGEYWHAWSGVPKSHRARSGVSVLMKQKWKKYIRNIECLSDRIIKIKMMLYGYPTTIIGVYGINDNALVDEKESFFGDLNEIIGNIPIHHEVILVGDWNGRVGNREQGFVGPFGEEIVNDNGKRILYLCKELKYCVANTFFQHKDIHKYTRIDPSRDIKSIIDLVIVRKERKMKIKDVRVFRQPECGSDHNMVVGKFIFPFRRGKEIENRAEVLIEQRDEVFKTDLLRQYSVAALYQNRINNILINSVDGIQKNGSTEEMYQHLKSVVFQAAREALGLEKRRKPSKKEMFSEDLENKIEEKKKAYLKWIATRNQETRSDYVAKRKVVKALVKLEKEEYWDRMCRDIDNTIGYNRSSNAWKIIKNMRSNVTSTKLQLIQSDKWIEYYEQLLQEDRPQYMVDEDPINTYQHQPEITILDVKRALRKAGNNKSAGPGNVRMELLKFGGDKILHYIKDIFNKIESGGDIPEEWNTAYISSIYKKGDKTVCANYRGISVIPAIARLFASILKEKIEK
ncbi:hypothetical protein R5R35_004529 [Gryllus longicercus]|uniref:Endonuclease/exonuclease/phosphatase domain-containing protein n=1 Tax=Gryllus longicercus TaxID=2509291 RepID=A0AAN9VY02_9ORTH